MPNPTPAKPALDNSLQLVMHSNSEQHSSSSPRGTTCLPKRLSAQTCHKMRLHCALLWMVIPPCMPNTLWTRWRRCCCVLGGSHSHLGTGNVHWALGTWDMCLFYVPLWPSLFAAHPRIVPLTRSELCSRLCISEGVYYRQLLPPPVCYHGPDGVPKQVLRLSQNPASSIANVPIGASSSDSSLS